jgi:hypothetical protein
MKLKALLPLLGLPLAAACAPQVTPVEAAVFVTTNREALVTCTKVGQISTARDKADQDSAFVIWPEGQSAGFNMESATENVIRARTVAANANTVLLSQTTTAEVFQCPTEPPAPATPSAPRP